MRADTFPEHASDEQEKRKAGVGRRIGRSGGRTAASSGTVGGGGGSGQRHVLSSNSVLRHSSPASAAYMPTASVTCPSLPLSLPLTCEALQKPGRGRSQNGTLSTRLARRGNHGAKRAAVRHRPRPKRVDGRWDKHTRCSHQSSEVMGGEGRQRLGQAVGEKEEASEVRAREIERYQRPGSDESPWRTRAEVPQVRRKGAERQPRAPAFSPLQPSLLQPAGRLTGGHGMRHP